MGLWSRGLTVDRRALFASPVHDIKLRADRIMPSNLQLISLAEKVSTVLEVAFLVVGTLASSLRATTSGVSPTAFSTLVGHPGLNLQYLRNPSPLAHLHFYLLPIIVFYHIPLQTFFDFNAVYILVQ